MKYSTLPGSGVAYFAVLASVFVTAFYAFRQYFMVFHGEENGAVCPNTIQTTMAKNITAWAKTTIRTKARWSLPCR